MLKNVAPYVKLALGYLLVSAAWILGTDALLHSAEGKNISWVQQIQSIKGLIFISISTLFIFFLAKRYYKTQKASLTRSEELLQRYIALGEASREAIMDHDLSEDVAIVNTHMQEYMKEEGRKVQHFTYKFRNRIHPDDRIYVVKNYQDTLNAKSSFWQADFRFSLGDKGYHDVIQRGTILRDREGKPVRFISILQDVTELRSMRTAYYEQKIQHTKMLGQYIIQAQESERNRWSEELHDNVGQLLTVVKLYMDMMATEKVFSSELLQRAQEMTAKALDDIRQLSASIKPPEFGVNTLAQSIQTLINNIIRIRHYEIHLQFDEKDEQYLNNDQKLMIYRVVQEQLNNIIKYAEASFISITIKASSNSVSLNIRDNGKGFDVSKVETGVGLRNIRSRLQVYSGALQIESAPGTGCSLTAAFSLS